MQGVLYFARELLYCKGRRLDAYERRNTSALSRFFARYSLISAKCVLHGYVCGAQALRKALMCVFIRRYWIWVLSRSWVGYAGENSLSVSPFTGWRPVSAVVRRREKVLRWPDRIVSNGERGRSPHEGGAKVRIFRSLSSIKLYGI